MANFTTHIGVGTLVSGMLATLTLAADVVAPENLVIVTAAGVLGSILPDIDLKDSRPSRAMFSGLAAFFSFASLFLFAARFSVAELWIVAAATFIGVRSVAFFFFYRMSYHRGIYHSILAGLFFAFFTAVVYRSLLCRPEGVAWLAAAFMFIGYMVHLTLDEIYSVDVMDTRVKASFGTALKLFDYRKIGHSVAMALATVAVFLVTPPPKMFLEGVGQKSLWDGLHARLLPRDKWFGVIAPPTQHAARKPLAGEPAATTMTGSGDTAQKAVAAPPASDATSPIATGSLPPPAQQGESQPSSCARGGRQSESGFAGLKSPATRLPFRSPIRR